MTDKAEVEAVARAYPLLDDAQFTELERRLIEAEQEWARGEADGPKADGPKHDIIAFHAEEYLRRLIEDVKYYKSALDASRAKDASPGWVLVPREPTPEMIEAAETANHVWVERGDPPVIWVEYDKAYRAMLSALPAPPMAPDPDTKENG